MNCSARRIQPPQGADRDPAVGRPARIIGIVHQAALASDDFPGNVLNGFHPGSPEALRAPRVTTLNPAG